MTTLWIIESTYLKPADEIAQVTPAHREWLDQHYRSGVFLTSGRKVDNTGGVFQITSTGSLSVAGGITGGIIESATGASLSGSFLIDVTVNGDFSLTRNANGTYTGAALNRTYLTVLPDQLSATAARFPVGGGGFVDTFFGLYNEFGHVMQESEYRMTLNPVAANPTVYAVSPISNVYVGQIVRNGTVLQAPLVNVPGGWYSRLVLTNTGSLDRDYEITVQGEDGNTIGTANLTGTVPAGKTLVIDDLKEVLTSFSGAPRATIIVTVAGPNNQIQGLYQIVNPDKGSISNHVLVRPGTN